MPPVRTRSRTSSSSDLSPRALLSPLASPTADDARELDPPPYSPPSRSYSSPALTSLGLSFSPVWAQSAELQPAPAGTFGAQHASRSSSSLAHQGAHYGGRLSPVVSAQQEAYAPRFERESDWQAHAHAPDEDRHLEFTPRSHHRRQPSSVSQPPIRRRAAPIQPQPGSSMSRARNVTNAPESSPPLPVSNCSAPSGCRALRPC